MKTKMIAAGLLAAASAFSVNTATAATPVEVTANIGVSNAYVFRGAIFGDDAQVSGGVDLSIGNFYAGTWISSQGGEGAGEEIDVYGGFAFDAGSIGVDLGYIYYGFPNGTDGNESGGSLNVSEIYGGLSFPFGLDTYVWIAPSGTDGDNEDEYVYLDLNYGFALTENTGVYLHYGYIQGFGDANDDDADDSELTASDYAVGLTIDDFFLQVSYRDDYTTESDVEQQYVVGWSKEFSVK